MFYNMLCSFCVKYILFGLLCAPALMNHFRFLPLKTVEENNDLMYASTTYPYDTLISGYPYIAHMYDLCVYDAVDDSLLPKCIDKK